MTRFPMVALGALVAATVGAFFFVQHLKVTTPFLAGLPNPAPNWINPVEGGVCQAQSHRSTRISFYLVHRSDDVNMYVVDADGEIVDQVASDRYMPKETAINQLHVRRLFFWNGRLADGSLAPSGMYYFHVALIHQGRAIDVGGPIHMLSTPPHPIVTSVSPSLIPVAGRTVTIHFTGNEHFRSEVLVYRTDLPGKPQLADSFPTRRRPTDATWNGTIDGAPAPPGTYLIGLSVTDRACATGRFPIVLPPPPGSTPHAGLTVRYLAAQSPLNPVPAGAPALVFVDSRTRPYRWTLAAYGSRKVLSRGVGAAPGHPLRIPLPRSAPGLYVLEVRSGAFRTSVPVVASAPRVRHPPRVLVVLPALTWQGENPVDDDGDGIPNTLEAGLPIRLDRPLADGLPAGLPDEAGLIEYLEKQRLPFDLTTDVGLVDGSGPQLHSYQAVVLAGSERWIPSSLSGALRAYVTHGGHVLSFGLDSLLRSVTVRNGEALHPTGPAATDALGARLGAVVAHGGGNLIAVIDDGLGIFAGTAAAFPGFGAYQPYPAVPGGAVSAAGASTTAPAIVGYRLGSGFVVDVGLVGFGSSLARDVDAQEFVTRLWQVLRR